MVLVLHHEVEQYFFGGGEGEVVVDTCVQASPWLLIGRETNKTFIKLSKLKVLQSPKRWKSCGVVTYEVPLAIVSSRNLSSLA